MCNTEKNTNRLFNTKNLAKSGSMRCKGVDGVHQKVCIVYEYTNPDWKCSQYYGRCGSCLWRPYSYGWLSHSASVISRGRIQAKTLEPELVCVNYLHLGWPYIQWTVALSYFHTVSRRINSLLLTMWSRNHYNLHRLLDGFHKLSWQNI